MALRSAPCGGSGRDQWRRLEFRRSPAASRAGAAAITRHLPRGRASLQAETPRTRDTRAGAPAPTPASPIMLRATGRCPGHDADGIDVDRLWDVCQLPDDEDCAGDRCGARRGRSPAICSAMAGSRTPGSPRRPRSPWRWTRIQNAAHRHIRTRLRRDRPDWLADPETFAGSYPRRRGSAVGCAA